MRKCLTITAAAATVGLVSCGGSGGGDGGYADAISWTEQSVAKEWRKDDPPQRVSGFSCVRTEERQATCDFTTTLMGETLDACQSTAAECSEEATVIVQFDGTEDGVRWEEQ
jgi:hypothetical protein